MRKLDCEHSRSVKMLPRPWFRKIDVCIEAKIKKFWNFSLKIIFLGIISCGESIARILEAWKCFREISTCSIFASIHTLISLNQGQGSIFTIRKRAQSIPRMKLPSEIWFWGKNFRIFRFSLQYTHLYFPESRSRKQLSQIHIKLKISSKRFT